ncbi:MAG: MFS transporter [Pseudomonadales bacterium]
MIISTVLSESRPLRFASFTALYFAQGIPIGLFDIAMPAYLAEQGFSAGQIGAFVGMVGLPWAFKLVAGPFMDRFRFPAMGLRRPWVLGAQAGLMLMLAAVAGVSDPATQWAALLTLAFLVNACAATQDVAVDGMAIDVIPLAERGRANAFMACGQVVGYGVFGALAGWLLANFGIAATALTATAIVAVIFAIALIARERPGERLLPWGPGAAAATQRAAGRITLLGVFRDVGRALVLPMSVVLSLSIALGRIATGLILVILPVFAVNELGFASEQYSSVMGVGSIVAAVLGLLAGPLIDRFGAKRGLLFGMLGSAASLLVFAGTPGLWDELGFLFAMLFAVLIFNQVFFIGCIAESMTLSWPRVAATQFAVYMAVANLARSGGGWIYGAIGDLFDFQTLFLVTAGFFVVAVMALVPYDVGRHRRRLDVLERHRAGTGPGSPAGTPAG